MDDEEPKEDGELESEQDARQAQANKLFQTAVMLIYGKRKSVEKAIKCIQRAITIIDSDYKYWQLLGEAYYQRGSLNPSINCFIKSLSLAEEVNSQDEVDIERVRADCVYSRLRMSDIRLSVAQLDEAADGYGDIIAKDPNNVAALVGLAKAELLKARNNFSNGLVRSGHSHCMNALGYALRATKLSPHLCLTWKLASDCCLTQFIYGQRGPYQTSLDIDFPGSDHDVLTIDRLNCINLAIQFLCKALAIEPFQNSGCLWHNLGVSLYLKSSIIKEPQEQANILKRSLKCLLKALDNDRTNSQIRNSIAIVTFNLNYPNSAQNFLIRSIQTNMSTSEIQFSNLGYLYLQKGEFRLASVAFNRCQAEEPLYCRSWLGNALVNEQNNLDNLSLLRHCHRLENNYESQLMYATKVTSLPDNDEFQKDLSNALDCMQRIINYDEQSLEAKNTLGLLFERSNFIDQARRYFSEVHLAEPQDSRVIFNRLRQLNVSSEPVGCPNPESSQPKHSDLIKSAEKLANGSNREYMLNFIYYLFMNQDYQAISPRMTRLVERLDSSETHHRIGAQILLALAAKADGSDFKSWLFKNIIDSEDLVCVESLINMLCLMLLGSNTGDQQLVEFTSNDLFTFMLTYLSSKKTQFSVFYNSSEGLWSRLVLISSIFCFKDQGKILRPLVALFPTVAELWLFLGISLMFHQGKHQTAIHCIKRASLIGSSDANLCFVCDTLLALATTIDYQHQQQQLTQKQQVKAKSAADSSATLHLSRALFRCPSYELLWKCLVQDETAVVHRVIDNKAELFRLAIDHAIKMIVFR